MGDADSGRLELEAARRVFRQLGASPDLAAVDGLLAAPVPHRSDSLTSREIEVLRLVASGRTNRAIAGELAHQREDRRPAPEQHLHQARPAKHGAAATACVPASDRLKAGSGSGNG